MTRAKISSPRETKTTRKNCANLASNMDPKASPPQFEGYAAHPVSSAGAGFDALFAAIDASCGASPSREPASKALLVGGQHTRVAVGPSAGSGLGNARIAPGGGAAETTTSPAPHPAWRPAQAAEGASSGKRQPAQDCSSSSSEGGSDGSTTHGQRAKTPRGATTTARPRAPARAAPTRTPPKPESPETPEYNEDEDDDDGAKAPFALRPLASVPVPPLDRDSKKKLPPALRQVNTPPSLPPSTSLPSSVLLAQPPALSFLCPQCACECARGFACLSVLVSSCWL